VSPLRAEMKRGDNVKYEKKTQIPKRKVPKVTKVNKCKMPHKNE
jgi:hypothetical protein